MKKKDMTKKTDIWNGKGIRRRLALGLGAAAAAGLLAGCGAGTGSPSGSGAGTGTPSGSGAGTEASSGAGSGAAQEGSAEPSQVQAKEGEIPTLVYWTIGGTPADDFEESVARISDYSEEKIGVRLDVKIAGWADYDQKMNTIVNSGEYFDIMFTNNTNYSKFVNLGAFADITDLVQSAAPQLYSAIPDELWSGTQIRGKVYAVPTYKDSSMTQFYYIDDAYVQKYGIDMSKLDSMQALDPIVRQIKEAEGKSFYPIRLDQGTLWNGFFNGYDGLAGGIQALGVKLDDASRRVVCTLEQEDIRENLKLLHSWYAAGIINPDANVLTESSKGLMFGNAQGWPSAAVTWAAKQGVGKYVVSKVFGPVYTTETIQGSMNAISVNSKYKEEALKLLELINTDSTFRNMCAYGVEGDHFEYTAEGFVKKLRDDWKWPNYTQGTYFILNSLEGADPNQWDEIRKQNEEAVASVCLGFALDITNIQNEAANVNTVWDKYKYDLLTGASDPEEVLPVCIEELKAAGLETIMAEAQKQIDEFFR